MDPYAAQTYPENQPPYHDPYLYNQPQGYTYYPQIQQNQYPNPEHAPIHPPGVPIQSDTNQIANYQHGYDQSHFQNDPSSYYQQQPPQQFGYADPGMAQQQQWQQQGQSGDYGLTSLYPPSGQTQSGSGRGRGRGFRGGGSSFRGRGGGRGRGGKATSGQPKPQCMAWCELCRVDCNTLEILENHKNGKKHKKNLKIQEDLQKLADKKQETEAAAATAAAEKTETLALTDASKVDSQVKVLEEHGSGLKRKMKDGERKSADPLKKPKEIIPFICELCNVKCESAPTFDSHLKGKKHMFNLQQFQEQQATLGQAALQALYPALEALYPALLHALVLNANASTSTAPGGLNPQVLQLLQAHMPQTVPLGPPQGPESGPGFVAQAQHPNLGVAQEAPVDAAVNEVKEPELKNEDKVEPESKEPELKIEDKVEPKSKTQEHVEPEKVESNVAEPRE